MAITNGFDTVKVLAALEQRIGWKQPTESGYAVLDAANQVSNSGRYFNSGAFHASCKVQNLYDCMEDADKTDAEFNTMLSDLRKDNLISVLNQVFAAPQLIESGLLYGTYDNHSSQSIANTGKFCGLKFRVAEGDHGVMLNTAYLLFDSDVTVTLHLFQEFKTDAVKTWTVDCLANEQKEVVLGEILTKPTGVWFLGYFQDELGSAKAIDYSPSRNSFLIFNAIPFEAETVGATDFKRNEYACSYSMYGLNIEASSYRDITNKIVQNAHLFDELQGLMMASKVMEICLNSPRSNKTQRISQEQLNVLYRELNQVTTAENPYKSGIKSRIEKELQRVSEQFVSRPKPQIVTT